MSSGIQSNENEILANANNQPANIGNNNAALLQKSYMDDISDSEDDDGANGYYGLFGYVAKNFLTNISLIVCSF